jgi:hypothetical protein
MILKKLGKGETAKKRKGADAKGAGGKKAKKTEEETEEEKALKVGILFLPTTLNCLKFMLHCKFSSKSAETLH